MEAGAAPLEKLNIPVCMLDALGDIQDSISPVITPQECAECEHDERAARYKKEAENQMAEFRRAHPDLKLWSNAHMPEPDSCQSSCKHNFPPLKIGADRNLL